MTALTEQRAARAVLRRTAEAAISAPDPDLSAWYTADSIALEGVNKLDRPYIAAADPALIVAILDAQDAAESEAVMLREARDEALSGFNALLADYQQRGEVLEATQAKARPLAVLAMDVERAIRHGYQLDPGDLAELLGLTGGGSDD